MLSDFERIILEYIAFNEGFVDTRIKARQMLDSECVERQDCLHGQDADTCGWCYAEKATSAPTLSEQPQVTEPRELTLKQREAIKWAIRVAHSGAKATPQGLVMFNHWKALCSLL